MNENDESRINEENFDQYLMNEIRALERIKKRKSEHLPELLCYHLVEGKMILVEKKVESSYFDIESPKMRGNFDLEDYAEFKIDRDPFVPVEVAEIMIDVCKGLSVLHSNNLFHGDLKPANIALEISYSKEIGCYDICTQVVDLANCCSPGIATTTLTPPEMLDKNRQKDARADIWALGIMMYWMLSGKNPFLNKRPEEYSEDDDIGAEYGSNLLREDCTEFAMDNFKKDIRSQLKYNNFSVSLENKLEGAFVKGKMGKLSKRFSGFYDLMTVIRKCLEWDPGRRYGSVARITHDLQKIVERVKLEDTIRSLHSSQSNYNYLHRKLDEAKLEKDRKLVKSLSENLVEEKNSIRKKKKELGF